MTSVIQQLQRVGAVANDNPGVEERAVNHLRHLFRGKGWNIDAPFSLGDFLDSSYNFDIQEKFSGGAVDGERLIEDACAYAVGIQDELAALLVCGCIASDPNVSRAFRLTDRGLRCI